MSAPKVAPALLRVKDAAKRLGVCPNTVYNLIADGDLDTVNVAPRGSTKPLMAVPEDSIAAFIEARRTNARRLRSA